MIQCLALSHLVNVAFRSHPALTFLREAFPHPQAPCSCNPAAMPVTQGKILPTLDFWDISGGLGSLGLPPQTVSCP